MHFLCLSFLDMQLCCVIEIISLEEHASAYSYYGRPSLITLKWGRQYKWDTVAIKSLSLTLITTLNRPTNKLKDTFVLRASRLGVTCIILWQYIFAIHVQYRFLDQNSTCYIYNALYFSKLLHIITCIKLHIQTKNNMSYVVNPAWVNEMLL